MNLEKNSRRWLAAMAAVTLSCSQGDNGALRSPVSPTSGSDGRSAISSVGVYPPNDVGLPVQSRFAAGFSEVGGSAVGDLQNGPIEILRVRLRPADAPGFYAEPGGVYRVNPGTPVEFWIEWTSPSPLETAPRLAIDWGFSEADNIHCGPCRLDKSLPPGIHQITIRMDDRVGGVTRRTFTINSEFVLPDPSGPVCTPLTSGATVAGSINGTAPLQSGRVFRDGIASVCPTKAYPGIFGAATMYGYTVHSYTAPEGAPVCLTVNFDPDTGGTPCGTNAHMSAYLGSYDPANQAANYVGDVGSSVAQPFSFTVPGGAAFKLVVTNTAAAATCGYTFSFTSTVCQ